MNPENQSETIAFLSTPAAFDDGTKRVDRITTATAELFLGKTRVFKLKRAGNHPNVDFSSKDLRLKYCEAEIAINRRTAPDMYLGVRPITQQADGSLAINTQGNVVDWVVEMVRFDESRRFDRLAQAGQLDRFMMEQLADQLASFHAHVDARQDGGGRLGTALTIESNAKAFASCGAKIVDEGKVKTLIDLQYNELSEAAPLLESRRRNGCVRHCHGDLHLGKIFLGSGDVPTLYDAVEYKESLATIDVLYDFALLILDLEGRDLRGLAAVMMNRYMDITGSGWGLFSLPLFLSLRATIRSQNACCAGQKEEARGYLDRALGYLDVAEPRLVAVAGLSGSGKSRLGRDLSPLIGSHPGARVVRSDVLRKRIAGVHPLDKLGSEGYTKEMTQQTYQAVYDEARTVLLAGHSVIADCVFSKPEERLAIQDVAREANVPFHGLWLEASSEIMAARVTKRQNNASDANAEVVQEQLGYDVGEISWARIDSSGPRNDTDAAAMKILNGEPLN